MALVMTAPAIKAVKLLKAKDIVPEKQF